MDVDVSQLGAGQLPNRLFRRVVWDVPQLLLRGELLGGSATRVFAGRWSF
jgi:hypothetical protein